MLNLKTELFNNNIVFFLFLYIQIITVWKNNCHYIFSSFYSIIISIYFLTSVLFKYLNIDGLHLFWFSRKNVYAHISGRQTKNKLKEKHAESSEQLVNRVPTSIYTSFVSVDFERNMPDSCAAFGCTNRRSTTSLKFYQTIMISWTKRYPELGITKWVTAKNDPLRK